MTDSVRYSIIVSPDRQERLADVAKQFHLSQGDVIEVLIDHMNEQTLQQALVAKRDSKVERRGRKKDIDKAIERMTAEERQALLEKLQQSVA